MAEVYLEDNDAVVLDESPTGVFVMGAIVAGLELLFGFDKTTVEVAGEVYSADFWAGENTLFVRTEDIIFIADSDGVISSATAVRYFNR